MGNGLFSVPNAGCHLLPVGRMSAYGKLHHPFFLAYHAVDDSPVSAHDGMFLQLSSYGEMGCIIFTDDYASCGIPVNAMNDSGTQNAVDPGKAVLTMVHERIHQCIVVMSGSGVNHHTLGFIDHEYIFVFVKDVQRNILRLNFRFYRLRQFKTDLFFRLYPVICLHRGLVH